MPDESVLLQRTGEAIIERAKLLRAIAREINECARELRAEVQYSRAEATALRQAFYASLKHARP